MERDYIILTEELIKKAGYKNGRNVFSPIQDAKGRWVIDLNAIKEFPMLFKNIGLHKVETLRHPEDFPINEDI
ncbi:MAG: hypothetical protein ACFB0B_15370 [Thermonemataceae bacterium]|mgnify:CR=1 FL=1